VKERKELKKKEGNQTQNRRGDGKRKEEKRVGTRNRHFVSTRAGKPPSSKKMFKDEGLVGKRTGKGGWYNVHQTEVSSN